MPSNSTNQKTSLGIEENLEALLCYLIGFVSGLVFLVLEKENKYVRFHAWQSMVIYLGLLALWILLSIVVGLTGLVPFLGPIIAFLYRIVSFLIGILVLFLWVLLMYKAYLGERYKVPVAGDFAENRVSRE